MKTANKIYKVVFNYSTIVEKYHLQTNKSILYLGIGSCACTAAPHLDPIQIIEQLGDEVMMQKLATLRMIHKHGEDWKTGSCVTAQDMEVFVVTPSPECSLTKYVFTFMDY